MSVPHYPKGSKYHYGIYLDPQNTLQVYTIMILGPFGYLTHLQNCFWLPCEDEAATTSTASYRTVAPRTAPLRSSSRWGIVEGPFAQLRVSTLWAQGLEVPLFVSGSQSKSRSKTHSHSNGTMKRNTSFHRDAKGQRY